MSSVAKCHAERLVAGAQEFKKLFEEAMEKNSKFVSAADAEDGADDSETNGAAAKEGQAAAHEEKTQDKSASELADNIKDKVKVQDS